MMSPLRRRPTPGRPGWLPTQAPHRPVRAGLPHTVLQVTGSLRDLTHHAPSGPKGQLRYPLKSRWDAFKVRWPCHLALQQFRDPTPPFPPRGPSGWFPRFLGTIGVLRRPESIPPHFVSFAWRYRDGDRRFAPPGYGRPPLEAWTFDRPEPTRDWIAEISGFSQVPGRTPMRTCPGLPPRGIPNAKPVRRRGDSLPLMPRRRLPDLGLSGLCYHGLHTRCLRFATAGYPDATQDSLPVGG